jgi:hypothetical protein
VVHVLWSAGVDHCILFVKLYEIIKKKIAHYFDTEVEVSMSIIKMQQDPMKSYTLDSMHIRKSFSIMISSCRGLSGGSPKHKLVEKFL